MSQHRHRDLLAPLAILWLCCAAPLQGADAWGAQIHPFLDRYCLHCHNADKAKGKLDLSRFASEADVARHFRDWQNIADFIGNGEMPPTEAKQQPDLVARETVLEAIDAILVAAAAKQAGDPGPILPRRLSATEFACAIRDLIGHDIQPTRTFPSDPAGGEGFDNTGEALAMTPDLLKKYLAASQEVASHLVVTPDGMAFAPFPMLAQADRRTYTEQAIIDFYHRHTPDLRAHLVAAWRYRHREAGARTTTPAAWASAAGLSPAYFVLLLETLEGATGSGHFLQDIARLWSALPGTGDEPRSAIDALLRSIEQTRGRLHREYKLVNAGAGNWPIAHLAMRDRVAAGRDRFDPSLLRQDLALQGRPFPELKGKAAQAHELVILLEPVATGGKNDWVQLRDGILTRSKGRPRNAKDAAKNDTRSLATFLQEHDPEQFAKLGFGRHPRGGSLAEDAIAVQAPARITLHFSPAMAEALQGRRLLIDVLLDPDHGQEGCVAVRSGEHAEAAAKAAAQTLVRKDSATGQALIASADAFCKVFPSSFAHVDPTRGLAAGFHLVDGLYRDDRPLMATVLDEAQCAELDRLWRDLDFITVAAEGLLRGFVWFERSERHVLHDQRFDFLRAEDPLLIADPLLGRFETTYLAKIGKEQEMIQAFFARIRRDLARHQELLAEAERAGLDDLEDFAARAWRRPLASAERRDLRTLYQQLRREERSVEQALRDVTSAILISPAFCYLHRDAPPGEGSQALDGLALASRLSFFLWSSIPDAELTATASAGSLQDEAELRRQVQRMLRDEKVAVLARDFFGQWLRYRDYPARDPVNQAAFSHYTDELRAALAEEPTRLAAWLIREDLPITGLLTSDSTFVNGVLAQHYGRAIAKAWQAQARGKDDPSWYRVEGLHREGRGGLFGMGAILAKNAVGERTSPVKRGFWAVHHLLGQHFPPPPPDVPELPAKETDSTKTVRELLAEHTRHPDCAVCHVRFDGLGLAMEGFDATGRRRSQDLAGRAIDDAVTLPDGSTAQGIAGLMDYVSSQRQEDFRATLCRKLLGYALGRAVLLSDRPLLQQMAADLVANDHRLSVAITSIVLSPQFRRQRGRDHLAAASR